MLENAGEDGRVCIKKQFPSPGFRNGTDMVAESSFNSTGDVPMSIILMMPLPDREKVVGGAEHRFFRAIVNPHHSKHIKRTINKY